MKAKSLFKVQSLVAIVLFTSLNSYSAEGGDTPDIDYDKLAKTMKSSSDSDRCSSENSRVDSAQQALQTQMQTQLQSTQESQKDQLKAQQAARQDAIKEANAAEAYQATVNKITNQLTIDKQKAQSSTADALAKIRQEIIQLNQQVNAAKNALRKAADAIDSAKNDKETACRSAAEKAGNDEQTKIDTQESQYQTLKQQGKAFRNNNAYSVASSKKARENDRYAKIQKEYLRAYKNCMAGTTAAGSAADSAIKNSMAAYATAQADFNNQMQTFEQAGNELKIAMAKAEQDGVIAANDATAKAQAELDAAKVTLDAQISGLKEDAQEQLENMSLAVMQLNQTSALSAQSAQIAANSFSLANCYLANCEDRTQNKCQKETNDVTNSANRLIRSKNAEGN